jgi:hypothetical protein
MNELESNLGELTRLIILYKYDEALDKFYDEQITTHENENTPVIGLNAYKEAARKVFYDNVSNYSAELLDTIIGEGITACQWHYKFDHKMWGHWDKVQLSVQRCKNGKIIHERHYYK